MILIKATIPNPFVSCLFLSTPESGRVSYPPSPHLGVREPRHGAVRPAQRAANRRGVYQGRVRQTHPAGPQPCVQAAGACPGTHTHTHRMHRTHTNSVSPYPVFRPTFYVFLMCVTGMAWLDKTRGCYMLYLVTGLYISYCFSLLLSTPSGKQYGEWSLLSVVAKTVCVTL